MVDLQQAVGFEVRQVLLILHVRQLGCGLKSYNLGPELACGVIVVVRFKVNLTTTIR